jgi:flavin-binding protein dodecin
LPAAIRKIVRRRGLWQGRPFVGPAERAGWGLTCDDDPVAAALTPKFVTIGVHLPQCSRPPCVCCVGGTRDEMRNIRRLHVLSHQRRTEIIAPLIRTDPKERGMSDSVYRVTEVIGTSSDSWEAAARSAVETAARSIRDLRVAEATRFDVTVKDGKIADYRVRLNISFKYETGD